MDHRQYEEIEEAAFAAWPALEPEETVHGWRLRYSSGYTKRANSANCTLTSVDLAAARIDAIEARYRQRGLPVIFRLTAIATPPNIDRALAERGYRWVDPSWVMVLPTLSAYDQGNALHTRGVESWIADFRRISRVDATGDDIHRQMLHAVPAPCAFVAIHDDREPICCGRGVICNGRLGLFDLATVPERRVRGHANGLCTRLLTWGYRSGARSAYLQVMASNSGALRFYEKLGFVRAYRYWYRVSP